MAGELRACSGTRSTEMQTLQANKGCEPLPVLDAGTHPWSGTDQLSAAFSQAAAAMARSQRRLGSPDHATD